MARWSRGVGVFVVAAMCSGWAGTAVAVDPLVLFLLRMIRDSVVSSAIEAGVNAAQQPGQKPPPPLTTATLPPPPVPEGQWLRSLIDESFLHLSDGQRAELHGSLMRILDDPRYQGSRSTILAEFTGQAISIRDAHRRLSRLNAEEMKVLAVEARREYERLPVEERKQLLTVLQHGIPGMPRSLNEVMLSEFRGAAPTP